ncbi:MAG: glutamate synthase subunit beta [Burkholderiaceae bacterium]|nr:glutamate synthase subunit beta [Burkholderiaceae bacterium]
MGKITGFLEFARLHEAAEEAQSRVRHFREFIERLPDEAASRQGARCMDCGVPFCQTGCPVNNIIPDWNDLVYRDDWKRALDVLLSTNNFPEFTGRICPAPCEAACTLNINDDPVGIKSIEHAIVDKGWEMGWIVPQPAKRRTGKRVAIVGSGPAGLACAQQLARVGHDVTVFEKNDRAGGLLRYGIPDFKLEKRHIDRRVQQMREEGVRFRTGVHVCGDDAVDAGAGAAPDAGARSGVDAARVLNLARERVGAHALLADFDAVVLAAGAEQPRDLPVPGRELDGVHFAMEFLPQQNRVVAGDLVQAGISAQGRHVVVIGGGDTGSDCVGTSNRQGAASVTQLELMPQPPLHERRELTWPYWPYKLRTSSSHEEGCERDWAIGTRRFVADADGRVRALVAVRLEWTPDPAGGPMRMREIEGSEFEIRADLVLLAMGFVSPLGSLLEAFGVERDARGNARAPTEGAASYRTSVDKLFAAGDVRRGQSLVVWAIREGRQCARAVDESLMGNSALPR